jgi:hypothetical protein
MIQAGGGEANLRARAVSRLRRERDLRLHARIYLAVNAMLVLIWAVGGGGFFWPVFPMLGWGLGLGFHAWDVRWRKPIGEEEIRREVERLQG